MTLNIQAAPHIRHHENTRNLMLDMIMVLLVSYGMAFYYHGPRAIALGAVSVITCYLTDLACVLIAGKRPYLRDMSAFVTGLIMPLMMPVSVTYSVPITAAIVAIAVAKHPFGGVGHNIFNPAAAGFSFATICFTSQVFTYPMPLVNNFPVFGPVGDFVVGVSPASILELGGVPKYEVLEMALGNFPGPMGATNILVILACLLYLVFRNTVRWGMPAAFFLTVSLFALLFPRTEAVGFLSVAYEMMSGILLFGGVFLLGDPVTTPKRDFSKLLFGIITGLVVMLFRRFGQLEEEFTFALLLMNAAVWGIDMLVERLFSVTRRKQFEVLNGKEIQKKT